LSSKTDPPYDYNGPRKLDSKNGEAKNQISVRKSYSPEFKTKIVLEILWEKKTLAQLSSEYGIHPTQLKQLTTQLDWLKKSGLTPEPQ